MSKRRADSYACVVEQERLIAETTARIHRALDDEGMTQADLARALGVTRAAITQMLDGRRNLTLRTVAKAMYVLNCRIEPVRRYIPKGTRRA